MSERLQAAWQSLKDHPLLSVTAVVCGLLLSLITWNGTRALGALDAQESAIERLDERMQSSLATVRDELGDVREDIARMQERYQAQVPDLTAQSAELRRRLDELERETRLLKWQASMTEYQRDNRQWQARQKR